MLQKQVEEPCAEIINKLGIVGFLMYKPDAGSLYPAGFQRGAGHKSKKHHKANSDYRNAI